MYGYKFFWASQTSQKVEKILKPNFREKTESLFEGICKKLKLDVTKYYLLNQNRFKMSAVEKEWSM